MLARIDLRGRQLSATQLRSMLPRGGTDVNAVLDKVEPVVEAVRHRGANAALEYGEEFDHVRPASVRVPKQLLYDALAHLDPAVREALEEAIVRIRKVHRAQRRRDTTVEVVPGGVVTERWVPVGRVGLYVPGGNAVYPSSVLMNVIPAQEAGVASLVVASPPQAAFGGLPHPSILAACELLGVDEVWAVGGAQAIALMAYGGVDTDQADDPDSELAAVDMITGPGNIFVTAAKRLCRGVIGIDSEAGPTEIAILADDSARPDLVAADLISQAEHDVLAASVLVTDSTLFAEAVIDEVEIQAAKAKHENRINQALLGSQSGVVLVDDIDQGIAVVNAYGAEHLEVQTRQAEVVANRVVNAGAIFVGDYSPVPLGDYAAGSNHVLPTAGSARYSSGLSVQTFLKGVHVVNYDKSALQGIADHVIALAEDEDLPAHGTAIKVRFETSDRWGRTSSQGVVSPEDGVSVEGSASSQGVIRSADGFSSEDCARTEKAARPQNESEPQ